MTKNRSNTTEKEPKEKKRGGATGKGFDVNPQNINRKGRPKSFDQLRALFQEIASDEITVTQNGKKIKITRAAAIGIAMSMDKKQMKDFLEFAYGKVPQAVDLTGKLDGEVILRVVREEKKKQDAS